MFVGISRTSSFVICGAETTEIFVSLQHFHDTQVSIKDV